MITPQEPEENSNPAKRQIPRYSMVGFCIIIIAEILLFMKISIITIYFTPLVWTGYIFAVDGLVYYLSGTSRLTNRVSDFALLCIYSIGFWLIFEAYNLLIHNWRYEGLPESWLPRYFGYAWAFATIYPAIFETRDLLVSHKCCLWCRSRRPAFSKEWLAVSLLVGLIFLAVPLISPSPYHAPLLWTGFVFFLEPVNYWGRGRSLIREIGHGLWQNFWALIVSGVICGVLWEFWNYWAAARWVYSVPYPPYIKIFEMPLIGYLGFPVFALECFVMYSSLEMLLKRLRIPRYREQT